MLQWVKINIRSFDTDKHNTKWNSHDYLLLLLCMPLVCGCVPLLCIVWYTQSSDCFDLKMWPYNRYVVLRTPFTKMRNIPGGILNAVQQNVELKRTSRMEKANGIKYTHTHTFTYEWLRTSYEHICAKIYKKLSLSLYLCVVHAKKNKTSKK